MSQSEPDTEQEWIRLSQNGDHDAFQQLITQHQRMIHSLTFRMTGSLHDAEDLSQETFIQAFRQLGSFRGEAKFSSWLYRIAMNLCLNWKKSRDRRQNVLNAWAQEPTEETSSAARTQQVQEALLKLNPKQRAAIVLTCYDGMNHAEAARVLGCSETTISWRVFAARAKLKKLLSATLRQERTK